MVVNGSGGFKTADEVLESMSSEQISELIAFLRLEPLPDPWHFYSNIMGALTHQESKLFLPLSMKRVNKQSDEEIAAALNAVAKNQTKKYKKNKRKK